MIEGSFVVHRFHERSQLKIPRMFVTLFKLCLLELITAGALTEPKRRIVVGFTKREPFVFTNQVGALKGLDVLIVKNFARKFNLKLEFIEQTVSMNEIWKNYKVFEVHTQQINLQ